MEKFTIFFHLDDLFIHNSSLNFSSAYKVAAADGKINTEEITALNKLLNLDIAVPQPEKAPLLPEERKAPLLPDNVVPEPKPDPQPKKFLPEGT
jgi:hypothetical protein